MLRDLKDEVELEDKLGNLLQVLLYYMRYDRKSLTHVDRDLGHALIRGSMAAYITQLCMPDNSDPVMIRRNFEQNTLFIM